MSKKKKPARKPKVMSGATAPMGSYSQQCRNQHGIGAGMPIQMDPDMDEIQSQQPK